MRVLVVVHGFPPMAQGGAEIYAHEHATPADRARLAAVYASPLEFGCMSASAGPTSARADAGKSRRAPPEAVMIKRLT